MHTACRAANKHDYHSGDPMKSPQLLGNSVSHRVPLARGAAMSL
jgi:hypothetical protein